MRYFLPFLLMFTFSAGFCISPLPPINSQAEWIVRATGQFGVQQDLHYSYGQKYQMCDYTYVAVLKDEVEELVSIPYLPKTD